MWTLGRWLVQVSIAFLAVLAVQASASAERVVVLPMRTDTSPPRPGFVDALRIQLTRVGPVADLAALEGSSFDVRIDQAAGAARRAGAALAVWLEPTASPRVLLVHMVGPAHPRALVEVVRMSAGTGGPELDRAIALKVAEVLDTLRTLAEDQPLVAPLLPPPPMGRYRVSLDGGALVAGPSGTASAQVGAVVSVALTLEQPTWLGDAFVAVGLPTSEARETADGKSRVGELDVWVGARWLSLEGGWAFGAAAEVGLRFLDADGVTPGGNRGGAGEVTPTLGGFAEGRLRLAGDMWLRLSIGPELALSRRRFTINDAEVLDMGVLRLSGRLALLVMAP
jgi:hypothetical protein